MTELELFPRGKGTSTASSSQEPRTVSSSSNRARDSHGSDGREESAASRKRKAPGAIPGQKADERDWLFGAPKAAPQTRAPLKETRSSKNEATSEIHRKVPSGATAEAISSIVEERHGRSPRLTSVSSKSLVKGTLVLGVIFKVDRSHISVSLPAGLTGVVRKSEVSDFFYAKAAAQHRESYPGAPLDPSLYGTQLDDVLSTDCELSDIFHVGQVLRCGILLTKEADRRRFDLTLRASLINRGLSLSQLKDGCGICGCIISAEDHGFVTSLGLDGVTAFVPLSQAPKQGFKIGQPVEAVVTKVKAAARTVTLSTDPGMVASALSTGSGFDLRSIKPGMLVETELDKILPNGITVTFLDFFSGCVDHDNMPVVSTDCKDDPRGWRGLVRLEPKRKARVLMVNYALKAIRLTMRPHLLALERPSGLPPLRSVVKAKVLRIDPSRGLLLKVMGSDDVKTSGSGIVSPTNGVMTSEGNDEEGSSEHEQSRTEGMENGNGPGALIEAGDESPVVGAYVHVTKIGEAGVKTENLRKAFPRGKEVLCRVLRGVTLEGRVSTSLRPSHLLTSATRYEDLCVGQVVEAEMVSVNEVGIVVKLGEGLRALVRNNDIGEVRASNPSSRFKLGARVKGKVLKVNLQRRRAFVTLKKSMVEDNRPPLKRYQQATPGRKCLGMVVKVGSFGLHVAFYNGVVGVVPMKQLKKHGVDNPSEAFRVGQTTACRVLKCNWKKCPVKLLLRLDVPGEVEEEEKSAKKVKSKRKPVRAEVGDILRGMVSKEQEPQGAIAVDLFPLPSPDGAEGQNASGGDEAETSQQHATKPIRGYLMLEHVGDNVSICRRILPPELKPGTELRRLLVYGTSRTGAPLVTMKPLLLYAASHRPSKRPGSRGTTVDRISIPSRLADVTLGDVVAGYVSSIKEFGVFVSFFGGLTALCPKFFLVDGRRRSPEKQFTLGDSVRCLVRRVNPDSGLVSVDMRRSQMPSSSLLYTRSLLWETFTAMAVANARDMKCNDASEKGYRKPLWAQYPLGMNLRAQVVATREDGVILKIGKEGEEQRMLCPPEHVPDDTLEEGKEVEVRVLGVQADTGMLDVTMDSDLVKAGKDEDASVAEVGTIVSANIILAKPSSKFAVAARRGSLFVVEVADFNCSARTNEEAGHSTGLPGEVITARVGDTFATEAEGFWEAQRNGPLQYCSCNPYAGARILVPTDGPKSKGKKSGGAEEEHLPERKKQRVEVHKLMKTGKIPLKDILPGEEVTCQVSSVLPDHLNVKVAVKFAKKDLIATGRSEDGNVEDGDDAREPRVRARIHCAWAGKPDVDAPSVTTAEEVSAKETTDEALDAQLPVWHPLRKYHEGQVLKARVLLSENKPSKNKEARSIRMFELGLIKVCDDETPTQDLSPKPEALPWWGRRVPKRREVYRGVVMKTDEWGVKVSLSSSVEGFLSWKNIEETSGDARTLFHRGMGVRVQVSHVDEAERRVVLTRKGLPSCEVLPDSKLPTLAPKRVATAADTLVNTKLEDKTKTSKKKHQVGDIAKGKVSSELKALLPPSLMVRLDSGQIGRVCITEVADDSSWQDSPLNLFEDGKKVTCRVLRSTLGKKESGEATTSKHRPLELSLRPSRVKCNVDAEVALAVKGAPEVDSIVKAYVEETTKVGCFVRLSGGVRSRVLLKDLHDRFLPNPGEVFPTGKLVIGKVLAKDADGQVSLTLKPSKVADGVEKKLKWSNPDLKPGLKVKGNVSSVQTYGAFIDVDDSEIRGMAHRSEAADHSIEDMTTVYEVGDRVKAVVLKVDKEKKRLSLGLKPSYFEGDPDESSEEEDDDKGGLDSTGGTIEMETSGVETNSNTLKDEGSGSDDEPDEDRKEGTRKRSRSVLEDVVSGGASNAFGLDFGHFGSRVDRNETESEDDEHSEQSDEDATGGAGHRSRKKARERREEEEKTVAKEKALLDEDAAPETDEDFERLVIASPNDSLTWVQFMAFKLSLADIDGARSVAKRALKTISFRREQERFNVWVSLLNLEHKFGSSKSLRDAMERACQNSNPKKVYLHMAQIHAKAKEIGESDEVYESAVKKFRHSKKVWMAYQLSRIERGDATGAREILQRSLQSLAKHKHVLVISRFAQNEFELGSVERGRTVFEGLMASYPKRLDLWNVYVDKEIKAGQLDAARNLLERMTGMEFNAKRMKGVFKKYLQFEMEHGDEAGVEAVKAKATDYVASVAG